MTATAQSVTLVTWAHWKEITRQALEDIPQIRSIVEGRLRQGLVGAIEDSDRRQPHRRDASRRWLPRPGRTC